MDIWPDSKGRKVDWNTILIMTSNLGATALSEMKAVAWCQTTNTTIRQWKTAKSWRMRFGPELLNRYRWNIISIPTKPELRQITPIDDKKIRSHLVELNIELNSLQGLFHRAGRFDPEYGTTTNARFKRYRRPTYEALLSGKSLVKSDKSVLKKEKWH